MSDPIKEYIQGLPNDWQIPIAERLHALVHEALPEATERIQYGKPHFLKGKNYAAVISPAKGWVAFTIFNATEIEGPEGFFEEGPPERKTIKIKKDQTVDYDLLGNMLKQAVATL